MGRIQYNCSLIRDVDPWLRYPFGLSLHSSSYRYTRQQHSWVTSRWPASVTCTEGQNVRAAGNYKPSNDVDLGVDHLRWPCSYSPSRNPDALQANLVGPAVRPANGARASGKPALPRYSASTAPHDKSREMADLAHRLVHRVAS